MKNNIRVPDKEIEKILNSKINRIKDLSLGCDQLVFLIETEKEKYIYKEPKVDFSKIKNEEFALIKLSSINIPIPNLIHINNKYLIESFLEGELLTKDCEEICFIELGRIISKIHSIKMDGFGDIKNGKGEYRTESEYLYSWLNLGDLTNKLFKNYNIKKIFDENKNLLKDEKSYFLHGDISYKNVIVSNNKINGIIDFGDIICGPIEYDLSLFYLKIDDENWKNFIKGYNKKYSKKKFHLYLIAFGIWLIQDKLMDENDTGYTKFLDSINIFLSNQI